MSLSLTLVSNECSTCGHMENTETLNYTYNVSPMWYEIFPDDSCMIDIDGLTGKESLTKLNYAVSEMENNPDKFIPMNPENGWGSYEGFKRYLKELIMMAENNPEYIWNSCR